MKMNLGEDLLGLRSKCSTALVAVAYILGWLAFILLWTSDALNQ